MTRVAELVVEGMDCPSCVKSIQARLERVPGIEQPEVLFARGRVRFQYDATVASPQQVVAALAEVGHQAHAPAEAANVAETARAAAVGRPVWREPQALRTVGAGALLLLAFLLGRFGLLPPSHAAYAASMALAGWDVARAAWASLRQRLAADMHVLMLVASVGAACLGQWAEAATILFLFGIAEALEAWSMDRARRAVASLMSAAPLEATVVRDGAERRVGVAEVTVGETLKIRPGERIPLDAEITAGAGAVDEAAVTGEPVPADKVPGDRIFAGTLNRDGFLEARVLAAAEDSTLARVTAMVEEAQTRRSQSERWVERFARRFTPAVLTLAALVAVVPPALFGQPWGFWIYQSLTLLIISCPCALVISTPVSMVCGLTAAARRGVLIKGAEHLERLGAARAIAFDKTGTLTRGEPEVREVIALDGTGPDELLRLTAGLERGSEHPLARAIVREAERRGLSAPAPERFLAMPGLGVEGDVEGRSLRIGRPTAIWGDVTPADVQPPLDRLTATGATAVAVAETFEPSCCRSEHRIHPLRGYPNTEHRTPAPRPLGLIGLADQARPEAAGALRALRALGVRRLLMLTGDAAPAATTVAAEVGIEEVHAGLMPAEKAERLQAVEREAGSVVMVGDGVNDAPALATASVSVAMGAAGTDIALETADVALMADDLAKLPEAIDLSRRTLRTVQANIAFSLALKALFVVLVLLGHGSLWLAVLADTGASLAVTAYALRLLRYRGLSGSLDCSRDLLRIATG
jgi:Cd2+/Zn2+-exporting ATPase